MALAVATGIPASVWATEGWRAITTAAELLDIDGPKGGRIDSG